MRGNERFIYRFALVLAMEEMGEKINNLINYLFTESMPYIFTNWQIKIIKKKLDKEPLTNSEKVEFSANIKKKIIAIQLLKDLYLILF